MKKRIWELDAFRGLCVLGMVIVHLSFDVVYLYRLVDWVFPPWLEFLSHWGGVLFLMLSGICVTLGRHSLRRGLIVFSSGMVITAVTVAMYLFRFANKTIIIYFGALHCLGICMILWCIFRNFPSWLLTLIGVLLAAAGIYLGTVILVDFPWLVPLGFLYPEFSTADYFPLLPHFGFFLLGAVIGRKVYSKKVTLFPNVNDRNPLIRVLCFVGRHSLLIYLVHQPLLAAFTWLLSKVL